ncbi:MAG: LytTR family transcriptional regulator [Cytophagales bacterium]|nr:LytTR family transcriptional regulator [Cytophagales bacterium]
MKVQVKEFVFIKSGKSTLKINFNDIEAMGNYVQINTIEKKKHIHYASLKLIMDKLPDEFMRVHNSYIVNLNHIDKIEDNHIYLGTHHVPVSPSKRECLQSTIDDYKL